MSRIGFVGLGAMGAHMARNLLAKGFAVRGFDLRAAALDALEAAGGSLRCCSTGAGGNSVAAGAGSGTLGASIGASSSTGGVCAGRAAPIRKCRWTRPR